MNPADVPARAAPNNAITDSAVTEQDRRLHPRYTVQVAIEIHPENSPVPISLATTDLSRGGCYLQISPQLALGMKVRARLWLDGAPIVVHGLVVTRHPEFGNGIMFMRFENNGERDLARYLQHLSA